MKFEDAPRWPYLPFIASDVALLVLAGLIAFRHPNPFAPLPVVLITLSVVLGCVALLIPFIVNYVRDQEVAASALRHELGEQFKRLIVASEHLQHSTVQLKNIEEIATKNVQTAEKLPYRLQEKIAEFNQQLAEAENDEKEALEQELITLRSTENERVTAAADKIVKALSEWAKLESNAKAHLAAAAEVHEKLASAVAAMDAKIAALEAAARSLARPLPPPVLTPTPAPANPPIVATSTGVDPAVVPPVPAVAAEKPADSRPPVSPPTESTPSIPPIALAMAESESAKTEATPVSDVGAKPPKPPRPPRKSKTTAPFAGETGATPVEPPKEPPAAAAEPATSTLPSATTPSAPASSTPPIASPAADAGIQSATAKESANPGSRPPTGEVPGEATKPARKPRAPRPPKPDDSPAAPGAPTEPRATSVAPAELIVEPVSEDSPAPESYSQVPPDEALPLASPTADGHTRLTVTSYIGIGNKLYLRGEGPGLSSAKGVPLQFVSIGRWRWETAEATAPVVCRILKNDKIEAPGGPLTIPPGTEREITASF